MLQYYIEWQCMLKYLSILAPTVKYSYVEATSTTTLKYLSILAPTVNYSLTSAPPFFPSHVGDASVLHWATVLVKMHPADLDVRL